MHPETREIAAHMKDFGLHLLGCAIHGATFSEYGAPFSHAMAVTNAAHGAELAIKARIAQEHPLLIFEELPKSTAHKEQLRLQQLLLRGKTVSYGDLPELLWATTGYRMRNAASFLNFGKLRNQLMHFAIPEQDLAKDVLSFACITMDEIVGDLWEDESVLLYADEYDPDTVDGNYLYDALKMHGLKLSRSAKQRLTKARGIST